MRACLFDCSFFKAFREARRSFNGMPPDCGFGTWADLLCLVLALGGGLDATLDIFAFEGTPGVMKLTAFLATSVIGVGSNFWGTESGTGLAGTFSLARGLKVKLGFLVGGPPDLMTLVTLGGLTLTTGKTGGVSVTGVLGM